MKFIEHLSTIYSAFNESEWVKRNDYVFWAARKNNLALAGSIAIAVSRKKAIKEPGDIDLVTPSVVAALYFIQILQKKLLTKKTYWKLMVNNETEFCPQGCSTHFRLVTPFWKPICVMVIPSDKFQYWKTYQGMNVQRFDIVADTAKKLDERDQKGRITPEIESEIVDSIPIMVDAPQVKYTHDEPDFDFVQFFDEDRVSNSKNPYEKQWNQSTTRGL